MKIQRHLVEKVWKLYLVFTSNKFSPQGNRPPLSATYDFRQRGNFYEVFKLLLYETV